MFDRVCEGGKIGIEGSNLNGSGNRPHFCRICKNISLSEHIARVPPTSLEEAHASDSPKA